MTFLIYSTRATSHKMVALIACYRRLAFDSGAEGTFHEVTLEDEKQD
jgi:hypothetical protein